MPAAGTPLPWDRGNGPCVMAPPHLRGWAEEAAAFLSRRGMDGITAFATSGSSGSPPKAIYSPAAPWTYARAGHWNIYMRKAGTGAARCLYGMWGAP